MWPLFLGAEALKKENVGHYKKLCNKTPTFANTLSIKKDVPRTFGENKQHPELLSRLERVLKAYSIHNSKVGYTQSKRYSLVTWRHCAHSFILRLS